MTDSISAFVPALDDIEFSQLLEQARAAIPRYAPDWTDHNLHDPGMTLIDLLAWIVDQQVYRTGFVGGRHRRAFAALLGQRPRPPAPARGLLWPVRPITAGRRLAAGATVTCRAHPDLAFALEHTLFLPPVTMTGIILTTTCGEVTLPSPGSADGALLLGPALQLLFDGPLHAADDETPVALGFDLLTPPGALPIRTDRPWGPVRYAYRTGGSDWTQVRVLHDNTAGLSATGVAILAIPRQAAAGGSRLRLSLDCGFFPVSPQLRDVQLNVLPVVQRAHLDKAPFEEHGTGLPDQQITFDTSGLVSPPGRAGGPALEIDIDRERWAQTTDLSRSRPTDPHYTLRPGLILFGNGINGRRPTAGAPITHTELARTAGPAGNLRPGLTWSVPALDADGTRLARNRHALTGGRDATTAGEITGAARDAAAHRTALLTDDDLIQAALTLPGMAIRRAEVLAGHDPRLPGIHIDGVRSLIVVPHRNNVQTAAPAPRPGRYLAEVAARLAPRRLLGERLLVQQPIPVPADLWLTLTLSPGAVAATVRAAAEQALRARLSLDERPLGRELTAVEVTTVAAAVPGVADVPLTRLAPAGSAVGDAPVTAPRDGVVTAAAIWITIEPGGG
ncbi:hypothetical protein [Streptomyces sp. NPDC057302]|uniref:hypothetical protein n=1 Tax=Streptomyces sp. NPDC057302 TaxID=3346094 RepID=UPI00362C5936